MSDFISRQNFLSWLSELKSQFELVAPKEVDGVVLFQPITEVGEIRMDEPTVLSPKEFFFPSSETLFYYRNGRIELPRQASQSRVLFGLRPCDGKGIYLLDLAFLSQPSDLPFLSPPEDPWYKERRQSIYLVGLACSISYPGCFCTSMGTGPQDGSFTDVFLIPAEDGFLVEAFTEKGKELLASAKSEDRPLNTPPPPEIPQLPAEDLPELFLAAFDAWFWEKEAERCLNCALCAYVCPTCYCFDIRDYRDRDIVERVRSWDSCLAPHFSRVAGRVDLRPGKGAKLRQRFGHKFLYFYQQFGQIKCTGCGRCIRACPVNIDIREITTYIHSAGMESLPKAKSRSDDK